MNPKAYRLPKHVVPTRYDVHLNARLEEQAFAGSVAIELKIKDTCDSIVLHAKALQLGDATLVCSGERLQGEIQLDSDREIVRIHFPSPISPGVASLQLTFQGEVSQGLEGLYVATDGPERLLCTQAWPTAARSIFPCFDEPAFKARFAFQIITSADATVLTNSPLLEVTAGEESSSKTWSFAPTKPMSSYLVALVVGQIASTQEQRVNNTPIRVWSLEGKQDMGTFAHEYTTRLLPLYETYFGIPFYWDKYDQVAVPGFALGAMENSGLVLFRQTALLLNPQSASWQAEKVVAGVVAHEFAHMWFGNLASILWWDDVWLSEAFAEWFAFKAVDLLSPHYHIWNDFQTLKDQALAADALQSTHPIYSPVATPAEALELFDAITYLKGCSVLRMLENYLGEEAFRTGIQRYMAEFAERNASGTDLWRNLQVASDEPVTELMESWIMQGGYPIIDVSMETVGSDTALRLRQRRFLSSPHSSSEEQRWLVPVVIRFEDNQGIRNLRYLLREPEATVPLALQGELRWCNVNAAEIGFYRQNPTKAVLEGLLAHLPRLSPGEQMGLLGDQWALVRNGAVGIRQGLDVTAAMAAIPRHNVLKQVVAHLHTVEELLEDAAEPQALQRFRSWVHGLFAHQLVELGFEPRKDEGQNDAQRRKHLVDAMTNLAQDQQAIEEARTWADREVRDPQSVDPNLAAVFIAAAARFGDQERFNHYVAVYRQRKAGAAAPQETDRYLHSFATFRDPALVQQTLALMDERVIPQESIISVLKSMLAQRHAQHATWSYVKQRWGEIEQHGGLLIGGLVEATGQLPLSLRGEIVSFFDDNLHGAAQQSYARAVETMDQLAEFKERTRHDLISWFLSH